jgi:hypothetical protein
LDGILNLLPYVKKSRFPKFLASDSGPTIQIFNLQGYLNIPGPGLLRLDGILNLLPYVKKKPLSEVFGFG